MFKFIQWFVLIVGMFCLNVNSMFAQTAAHPNLKATVSFMVDQFYETTPDEFNYFTGVYNKKHQLIFSFNELKANQTVSSSFDLDAGIGNFIFTATDHQYSDKYWINQAFDSTPYGQTILPIQGLTTEGYFYLWVLVERINCDIQLKTTTPAFDEPVIFSNVQFDKSMNENLFVGIYDSYENAFNPSYDALLASYTLAAGDSSFKLSDGTYYKYDYKSLIGKQCYLRVNYSSSLGNNWGNTYTSDFSVLPIFFTDRVDLTTSTLTPIKPTCEGYSDGGFKLTTIMMMGSRNTAPAGTKFRAVLRREFCDANGQKCSWKSVTTVGDPNPGSEKTKIDDTTSIDYIAGDNVIGYPAGKYELVIYAQNVAAGEQTVDIPKTDPLKITALQTDFDCATSTGSLSLTHTGGNNLSIEKPYNISFDRNSSLDYPSSNGTSVISGIPEGTNLITLSKDNCPNGSTSVTIDGNRPILNAIPASAVINPDCPEKTNGYIKKTELTLKSSGNGLSVTYKLLNESDADLNKPNLDGLGANSTYKIIAIDTKGCSSASQEAKTGGYIFTASSSVDKYPGSSIYHVKCNGDKAPITVTEILPENYTISRYEYKSILSSTWLTLDPVSLGAGTYDIKSYAIKTGDPVECSAPSNQVTIAAPSKIQFSGSDVTVITNPSCRLSTDASKTNTGVISLSGSGGVSTSTTANTYNYSISPYDGTVTGNQISGLYAGKAYTISLIDQLGCSKIAENYTLVAINPDLSLSAEPFTYTNGANVSCAGNSDGKITITATVGSGSYKYRKQGETTFGISNILKDYPAGSANYEVEDETTKCYTQGSVMINSPSSYSVSLESVNRYTDATSGKSYDFKCNAETNGKIKATVIGGGGGKKYYFDGESLDNGSDTKTELNADTHSVTVTDEYGCSPSVGASIKLIAPDPINIPIQTEDHNTFNVNCNGNLGTATAQPTGGVGGYTYLWDNLGNSATQTVNNLTPVIPYNVTVTDLNGCTASNSINLTQPDSLRIKNAKPVELTCYQNNSGEIIVETKGGVSNQTVILKLGNDTIAKFKNKAVGETSHFTGLAAGTYDIILLDNNGCTDHATATLTEPDKLTVDLIPSSYGFYYNIKCHGTSDTIRTDISGGTKPYGITWNDNGKYAIKTNAIAGPTYSVNILDKNKCSASASIQLVEPDTLKIVRKDRILPTCVYSNNGECAIHATGGVLPYTFSLDTAEITPSDTFANFTSLYHNLNGYPIIVHDIYNCTITDTLILKDRPILKLNDPAITIPKCHGGNNGIIQLSGVGGQTTNGIYEFHIIDDNVTRIKNGKTAAFDTIRTGNYTTVIIDDLNCRDTTTSIVNDATAITFTTKIDTNKCFNDNTAQLTIKAIKGYGSFKFAYRFGNDTLGYTSKPDSTLTLSGLNWNQYNTATPLPYHIYIRDANYTAGQPACSVHDQVLLPMVKKLAFHVESSPISCLGTNDGTMSVGETENAQGAISYSWLGPKDGLESVTSNAISGLAPGTYTVTVKDSHSCEFSDFRSFDSPPSISISVINTVADSGVNMSDGKAFFKVTGTGDTISYWLDGGLTQTAILDNSSFNVDSLSAESYTIAIANPSHSNCKESVSFVIKHQSPFLNTSGKLNATYGNADGMISVTASCGAGNFSYIWLNQAGDTLKQYTTSVTSTLGKGIYSVIAMDSEGNVSNTVTDTIIESDKLSIALMSPTSSPTCRLAANGATSVSARGGYRPYTFWWVNANGVKVSSDSTAINLLPGDYTAYVSDNRDTVNILTTLSPVNPIKDINLLTAQPSCHNQASGQVQISSVQGGSGNFSYQWSTGATSKNLDNLAPGSYTVTVVDKDAPGQVCSFTKPVVISSGPAALALRTDSVISPVCYDETDGKIYVSALGGTSTYSITWPGTMVKGAAYYNAAAGKHAVMVTDAHGCQLTDTINVENPLPLQFDQTLTQPKCIGDNNGSISLMMLNGRPSYSAKWTPELYTNSLQVNVPAGSYTAEITDANGCKVNGSFTILSPKPLKVDSFLVTSPGCSNTANGALTAQVSGGKAPYVYKWSNYQKGQTATTLVGGKYSVMVTDNNLCQTSGQVELTTPAPLAFNVDVQEPSCSGYANGSLVVTPQGGTGAYSCTVNLQPSELTVPDLYAGRYNITVKDDNNCTASENVWVSEPSPMVAVGSILSTITCANLCNGQAKLDVSGSFAPYSASWDDSGTGLERNDLCAGTFQVQITDSHGCQISKFVSMEQPDAITLDNIAVINPTCARGSDGSAAIVCSGGTLPYTISWDNGQSGNTVQGLSAATYMVTIADANNCSSSKNITVEDPAKETIAAFPSEFKLCEGQKNIINPGAWATYAWYLNNNKVSDTSQFNANQTGSYKISVVSDKGCKDSTTFSVAVLKDLLSAKFLIPNDVVTDDTVEIVDVSWPVPDSISWSIDSEGAQVIKMLADRQQLVFKNPGEYSIKLVAHKALCVSENEQTITVYNSTDEKIDGKQPIKPPSDIEELYLFPNPSNGSFTVRVKLTGISKVSLKIIKMAENKLIAEKESENSDLFEVPFDLPGLTPGVYLLNVQTETSQKNVKFVVM